MRKLWLLFFLLAWPFSVYAENIPQPEGWVNDFAGVINPEYKEKINALILELEAKTSSEIVVVTVTSIAPYDETQYARMLFDKWKPGKKGKDNGVLVLLAVKERRWRIETGYGVEGILPDGICGEIGRNYMAPYFKTGKYSEGIYYGVDKIAGIIAKETGVKLETISGSANAPSTSGPENYIIFILILFFILSGLVFPFLFGPIDYNRSSGGNYGGGFGGGGFGGGGF
ncbi:MAG: hypothetical protein COX41_04400, partial [Candidatus Omnitrophica bacterium CG23_combo_of_CG06-09_8_20_14_all_41_10]